MKPLTGKFEAAFKAFMPAALGAPLIFKCYEVFIGQIGHLAYTFHYALIDERFPDKAEALQRAIVDFAPIGAGGITGGFIAVMLRQIYLAERFGINPDTGWP